MNIHHLSQLTRLQFQVVLATAYYLVLSFLWLKWFLDLRFSLKPCFLLSVWCSSCSSPLTTPSRECQRLTKGKPQWAPIVASRVKSQRWIKPLINSMRSESNSLYSIFERILVENYSDSNNWVGPLWHGFIVLDISIFFSFKSRV